MYDRNVQFPNRYRIQKVEGTSDIFDVIPAPGEVSEEGTFLNKAKLLKDATAALYKLGRDAVPDDVLAILGRFHGGLGNEYVWEKVKNNYTIATIPWSANGQVNFGQKGHYPITIQYSASVQNNNGKIELGQSIQSITLTSQGEYSKLNSLIGNYVSITSEIVGFDGNASVLLGVGIYFIEGTNSVEKNDTWGYALMGHPHGHKCTPSLSVQIAGYVNNPDPSAYPPAAPDGFTYTPLGQLGSKAQIATGSYVGTGTAGSSAPNTLNFIFTPKFGVVHRKSASDTVYAFVMFVKDVVASQSMAGDTGDTTTNIWNNNSLEWYAASAAAQMNSLNTQYYYTFFG